MKTFKTIVATLLVTITPLSLAHAEPLAGLTATNRIVTFDSTAPTVTLTSFTLSGLSTGDQLIGIDLRPADGLIYGVSQTGRVYTVSTSGVASFVSTLSATPTGARFGFDFNPMADRLRIISDSDQNLRANVVGGATTVDTAITRTNGAPIDIIGTAYTNNVPGAASTVIYGIDGLTGTLVTSAAPNGGVYSTVGALGTAITNANNLAFDISGATGVAYLSIENSLYTVNLGSGAATLAGTIGAGSLIGLTAIGAVPEPTTWAMLLFGFGVIGAVLRRRKARLAIA